jgi:leader peptidase (prepilin peptidase)/N-methyltransferase
MIELTEFGWMYFTVLVFFFGACVGSFLNVCIYRIPRDESVVAPRSHCPNCNYMIPWYDNIPLVSYFVLRARCRKCEQKITPRYVLVEALVAVLFLLVWQRYGLDLRTPIYWMALSGLVVATFVDFEHMIIPDRISLGGILVGLVLSALVPSLHGTTSWLSSLRESVLGASSGILLLWSVGVLGKMVFKKDAMGMGDVKLLGAIGALLGWRAVIFTVMMSSLFGSVVGIGLIASRNKAWQSRIPYGPYIAMAAACWILGGYTWWQWYVLWVSGAQ